MSKYRVQVGAFVTRLVTRNITVTAKNEEEAVQKAIDRYYKAESRVDRSVDCGDPQIDEVVEVGI